MRGSFGFFKNANNIGATGIGNTAKLVSSSVFSTSSAGGSSGGGRGRGGSGPSKFGFVASQPGKVDSDEGLNDSDKSKPLSGVGRGKGKPLPSTPYLPSFNTFVESNQPSQQPALARGRGGGAPQPSESENQQGSQPKKPIFLVKDEATGTSSVADSVAGVPRLPIGEGNLPGSVLTVLTGSGRGTPVTKPVVKEDTKVENRHLRPRQASAGAEAGPGRGRDKVESGESSSVRRGPKLSREEAVKKAVGILARREEEGGEGGRGRGVGRGRGRGRGFRGRGRGRGRRDEDEDDGDEGLWPTVDDATEKLTNYFGPEKMNVLTEAIEEVLPDPTRDVCIDALDNNLMIELEPEYLLGDFETNPDIDEKPPVPLREALEKMKPFLVAYEGIENQKEWEEAVEEAMARAPLLKEIVDEYCEHDKVTAKEQQEKLERVAKTLPASAPDSVKRFTDRAVLSLQSNPGWGFDKKCQFMDKLVNEVSKSYK